MTARRRLGPLERALNRSVRSVALEDADAAVLALARAYAAAIDAGGPVWRYGPGFRDTLVECGLTPKARAAITKGQLERPAASPLDELRARREAKPRS